MTSTPRTTSTSDARKRQAEKDESKTVVSPQEFCRILDELDAADQPPVLPDTSGWVRRAPGDVIEAGTPYVAKWADGRVTVGTVANAFHVTSDNMFDYWTPPPVPREPWHGISTDRDKPTDAYVNGVPGRYWRTDIWIMQLDPERCAVHAIPMADVTEVELLHTHSPVTHVPVERALIDEAARAKHVAEPWGPLYDVVNALAALADGAQS